MPTFSHPWRTVGAAVSCVLALAGPAAAQLEPIPQDRGANGLALALRRIGVTPRVLYVTAHPDDENNGMLVRLSRGLGVRTALLTLTRGDGGQNAIGPELFDALAVLRSEELAAVHRYDAVEQYFGLSVDFGYSFSVEETFAKWGREAALGDVVRVMRSFRPDVVITLPLEAKSGGHHHQAAAQLAREAFRAAADPARYAEMGLPAWQAGKLYQGGVGGGPIAAEGAPMISVRTGVHDPLLGLTWQQFGSVARGLHRSQSTGQRMAVAGEGAATFVLLDSAPPVAGAEADVLDGLDLTFAGLLRYAPGHDKMAPFLRGDLQAIQAHADAARAGLDHAAPHRALPSLQALLVGVQALQGKLAGVPFDADTRAEVYSRLADEERDAAAALWLAHGLDLDVTADDDVIVPGQPVTVTARIANLGTAPISPEGLSLATAPGWSFRALEGKARDLAPGDVGVFRFVAYAPAGAPPSGPHWRRRPGQYRFELVDPLLAGQPWAPPPVSGVLRYRSGKAVATASAPARWRYEWLGGGEKQKVVALGSDFSVRVQPEVTVLAVATPAPREFRVAVRNQRQVPGSGRVRLEVPAGWTVEPREAELRFRHEGEEVPARFLVTPAPGVKAGETAIRAIFVDAAGGEFAAGEQVIAYEHVQERRLARPAVARVLALDVAVARGASVGYVDGVGDEVDTAIRQLGVPLTYLTADDLAFGDLSRFTTIVTGVRAYEARPDLRSFHHRLMSYVEQGGNMVVQYNRLDFNRSADASSPDPAAPAAAGAATAAVDSPYAPFPASVTSERITDENAPPRVIAGKSSLITRPNVIGAADWQGWVQERGLNFVATRDDRYENVVAFDDPFPLNEGEKRGALVDAPVGAGRWTYVGLGLFRQLPAGVPGAYRLLSNLVSRPRAR